VARNDFYAALANALAMAMPPDESQESDLEAVVDQCIALLERAGWTFAPHAPSDEGP
jgi:hypothetical protein